MVVLSTFLSPTVFIEVHLSNIVKAKRLKMDPDTWPSGHLKYLGLP